MEQMFFFIVLVCVFLAGVVVGATTRWRGSGTDKPKNYGYRDNAKPDTLEMPTISPEMTEAEVRTALWDYLEKTVTWCRSGSIYDVQRLSDGTLYMYPGDLRKSDELSRLLAAADNAKEEAAKVNKKRAESLTKARAFLEKLR